MDQSEMDRLQLLDDAQTAKLLKIKKYTLAVWRSRFPHRSPPYVKIGRHCYYRRSDLVAWINSKVVQPPVVA